MLNKKTLAAARIASGTVTDPDFEYVILLLHGDGTNGAQNNTFIDGSTNNFTVTRNGNTTQGSLNPFGDRWSNYFDGVDDYLSVADSVNLRLGSGTFTIEAWVYRTASGSAHTIFAKGGASTGVVFQTTSTNTLRFTDTTTNIDSTNTVAANTWVHVAVVREGTGTNQTKLYINGTQDGQGTVTTDFTQTEQVRIGTDRSLGADFSGYISNLRVVKGTAVYTSNFTPPTTPLTAVTNTSLLTCQSNRFVDNSSNNFTVTRNGDVLVRPFSPFSPSAAYSTSTNGGSAYFDGAGDYLSISSSSSLTLSGDYTLEAWIYPIDVSTAYKRIFQNAPGTTPSGFYYVYLWGTQVRMYNVDNPALGTNLGEFAPRAWFHLAICRSGSTTRIFINGSQTSTITGSTTFTNNGWFVGGGPSSEFNNVYVSSHRLVVGTAVYTANFTPPTAPLTAITNTALLLNFTNGGIIDNAADNVLETVGNAQISTSVKKFGTGSLAFDGTGDWLITSPSDELIFGTSDWTIEFWVNSTQTTRTDPIGWNFSYFNSGWAGLVCNATNSGDMMWVEQTNPRITATGTGWNNGSWNHVAITRSGNSVRMFLNGSQQGSTYTTSASYGSRDGMIIGALREGFIGQFNGYIDDLRITKGVARYTATFTPPTAAFPDL